MVRVSTKAMSKRRKIVISIVVAVFGVISVWGMYLLDGEGRLRAACDQADRVVVNLNVDPIDAQRVNNLPTLPSFEVKGRRRVAQLLEAIDLQFRWPPVTCACYGDMLFEFYEGQTLVTTVRCFHGESLAWQGWSGQGDLTADGQAALQSWLRANGCPTTEEVEAIMDEAWGTRDATEEPGPAEMSGE